MENQEYNDFDIAAMSEAVKMSGTALTQGQQPSGGPFGAAIYKNGKLIAASYNHVLSDNDPSAHGEVYTIREACKALNTWDLSEIAPNGQFTIHIPQETHLSLSIFARPILSLPMAPTPQAA